MAKTQNIEVCNQIIAQLGQDKPFQLKLDLDSYASFLEVWRITDFTNCQFIVHEFETYVLIEVTEENFDALYHKLSSYIAEHDLPEGVVQRLGEVS